uniref:Uncharacterized protein n=1 Tax=Oryza brachyantha TaxID=4533 RepID=J3N9K0_ORYBR
MDITVHSSKCVKPAYAYAGAGDAPAAADVVPLTVFDKVNFDMYISAIYAFRSPVPPNAVLEAGLAKALAEYRETVHSPDVEVNSWLRIPFRGMDFGGGPPLFGMPSYVPPAEGSVIVLPSFSWDGGVDAYVPLFRRDVGAFDRCCYSLADAGARL